VTPPSQNLSSLNTFPPRIFKPSKVYQIMPPLRSPIFKTIFYDTLPLAPMTLPLENNLYKSLNMATILGYPNTMSKESHKWFPKFPGNNVTTIDDHLYAIG
jgi:hypothetical protein